MPEPKIVESNIFDPNNKEHVERIWGFTTEVLLNIDNLDVDELCRKYGVDVDGESGVLYIIEIKES